MRKKLAEKLETRERKIIRFLKESRGNCSLAKIRKHTTLANTTVHRLIRKLETAGKIRTIKVKKIRVVILVK